MQQNASTQTSNACRAGAAHGAKARRRTGRSRLQGWFGALLVFPLSGIAALTPRLVEGQVLRYADEYPVMAYETAPTTDVITTLIERLERGELDLEFDVRNGYLTSLLHALDVPPSSQMLVFSKTSLQSAQISARTPRALYFNDDVYVAWVQGGDAVEIAAMDPDLGPVFYTLSGDGERDATFLRETLCLECHDSYSLTGGGVPRFLIGSGITSPRGQTVVHGGWNLTTDRTPIEDRWGGWYVTGTHGSAVHMGNVSVPNVDALAEVDVRGGGNVTDLRSMVDTSPYLASGSDIVALLVVEHQIHVQNLLTRVNWESRSLLYDNRNVRLSADSVGARIADLAEPLVEALLFVGEADLPGPITGTSGFRATFEARGRRDGSGRSLRELRLERRLFRFPLSYMVHADALTRLPRPARDRVFQRLEAILSGEDRDSRFSHVRSLGDDALSILEATHSGFRQWRAERSDPGSD